MAGIFKAYDIRGAYPDEINDGIAHNIGTAFARYLRGKRIVVAAITQADPSAKLA